QTCGQTEDLTNFRQTGEPKKSVFSRAFGTFRKIHAENGDGVPNVALYQAEPHLDMKFFGVIASKPMKDLLRCPKFVARCSLRQISTAATPHAPFICHWQRSRSSPS
ncbi:MAG: hypothetical protein IJY50_00645, partial [Clostridia bacterium]|nr:hypothetical protein [Clostridia bacterium]